MANLESRLRSREVYQLGEPISLEFEVVNNRGEDIFVLEWFTPLEGLRHDCLVVLGPEGRIRYDGLLVKRAAPVVASYIRIPANDVIKIEFELDRAYPVKIAGDYLVELDTEIWDLIPSTIGSVEAKVEGFSGERAGAVLRGGRVAFRVEGEGVPRETVGEEARRESPLVEEDELADPQPPDILGGTPSQRQEMALTHDAAFVLCGRANAALSNTFERRRWFGADDAARSQIVARTFGSVLDRMRRFVFIYDLEGGKCRAGDYAVTAHGSAKIYICPRFWGNLGGWSSRPGIVLHEHTHTTAGTDDIAYSPDDCQFVAIHKPSDAVRNASSYEYFALSV